MSEGNAVLQDLTQYCLMSNTTPNIHAKGRCSAKCWNAIPGPFTLDALSKALVEKQELMGDQVKIIAGPDD